MECIGSACAWRRRASRAGPAARRLRPGLAAPLRGEHHGRLRDASPATNARPAAIRPIDLGSGVEVSPGEYERVPSIAKLVKSPPDRPWGAPLSPLPVLLTIASIVLVPPMLKPLVRVPVKFCRKVYELLGPPSTNTICPNPPPPPAKLEKLVPLRLTTARSSTCKPEKLRVTPVALAGMVKVKSRSEKR